VWLNKITVTFKEIEKKTDFFKKTVTKVKLTRKEVDFLSRFSLDYIPIDENEQEQQELISKGIMERSVARGEEEVHRYYSLTSFGRKVINNLKTRKYLKFY